MLNDDIANALTAAVDAGFEAQLALTEDLIRIPSTRGDEAPAQDLMAEAMRERGLDVDRFRLDPEALRKLPGFSPVDVSYDDAWTVVGTRRAPHVTGRSLILNGHVDVVPAGPAEMWTTPPFTPRRDGDWLYGRGGGDMKAGVVACLAALDAFDRAGLRPGADVIVQSVIEEECTGNGALSCVARGYRADAVLIPEPMNEQLLRAQVGVIWFQVHVRGKPVHVSDAGTGSNAIRAAQAVMEALEGLEERWNGRRDRFPPYGAVSHPINLNIGRIAGGDWASSVPAWCRFDARIAIFPGQDIAAAKAEIEQTVRDAARDHPFLAGNPPEIVWNGFEAEAYVLRDAREQEDALAAAHRRVFGGTPQEVVSTATTDARFFGLYGNMPALVYGPTAENIHGFDERVSLTSLRQVTKTIALFMADWCGAEPA